MLSLFLSFFPVVVLVYVRECYKFVLPEIEKERKREREKERKRR